MPPAEQMQLINTTATANSTANIASSLTGNNVATTTIVTNTANYNITTITTTTIITPITTTTTSNIIGISSISNVTHDSLSLVENGCIIPSEEWHDSYFGVKLAVPEWEAILTAFVLSIIIVLTIIGNILVILSVFTYKPLRIVQNFFIVSLAVADLTVALLVLPFNVAYSILGRWEFGIYLCKMWLTCDIMCCTSSILNLCAIALDRYWAITDPINYAQKRTVGRVLLLIAGVWVLSLLISSPPLVGWNDWPEEFTSATPCELNSDPGYVIYSSLGSFYIPLIIMATVYIEIFVATRRRLRERAQAAKLNTITARSASADVAATQLKAVAVGSASAGCYNSVFCCCRNFTHYSSSSMMQNDQESISSETHVNNEHLRRTQVAEHRVVAVTQGKKTRRAKIKDSIKHGKSKARKTTPENKSHEINPLKVKDEQVATEKSLLFPSSKTNNVTENPEVSTESGSDPKGCIQVSSLEGNEVILAGDNDDENISLKITPPQSSIGATSVQASAPLQKKPGGVYQFIEEKQKISLSKERRAARTLGIIMGVFVICWLPFFLMYVILPFCSTCCPTTKMKNFITWLGYINSVLNPIIYTIFNLDYRRAFKRLLGLK